MEVTDDGMMTDASDEHPKKAELPMEVTDVGMTTDASDEHPKKA